MFEIVKMTHVCQYWRSTAISYPHLWSSVFVQNDHKEFIAACLERSREIPLVVHLDLKHGDYHSYPDCTCIRREWGSGTWIDEDRPCRYHTTIKPLVEADHLQRIRTLDIHLTMLDDDAGDGPEQAFWSALGDFGLSAFPVPFLESLSFRVGHVYDDVERYLEFPEGLFFGGFSPPTALRHLTLHRCYGGPILAVRNLTSFELAGDPDDFDPIRLDQDTFLLFISGNLSLASLKLSYCVFPDREQLSQVTPVELPELKYLQLMDIYGLSVFPGLVHIPPLKRLSSLQISTRKIAASPRANFLIHAESGDGFQLSYDAPNCPEVASNWLCITDNVGPGPAFVRFEKGELSRTMEEGIGPSPLVLFSSAEVVEIGAPFAGPWYRNFWKHLEKVGPQLTTLRLEIIEGIGPAVAESVEKLTRARFNNGTPLTKLERMRFEEMSEEDEEKAKRLWEEFRTGLSIDQYLAV